MSVKDELIELEAQFWESAGDPDFYQAHFADDGVMALPVGIMTKPEVVTSMSGASEWVSFTIDDPHFVELADDVAALVYTTSARHPEPDEAYPATITSVYVNRDDGWQLVLHQQTPL